MPNLMSAIGGVDISEATATAADVKSGKTFYSGASDEMQTGVLAAPRRIGQVGSNSNGSESTTLNVSGLIEGYQNITLKNFLLVPVYITANKLVNEDDYSFTTAYPNISNYNPSTGVLTISGLLAKRITGGYYRCAVYGTFDIYYLPVPIE